MLTGLNMDLEMFSTLCSGSKIFKLRYVGESPTAVMWDSFNMFPPGVVRSQDDPAPWICTVFPTTLDD